jgi:hypothetical protein
MTKLLHLAYAVWKTDKSFDPNHYPWDTAAAGQSQDEESGQPEAEAQAKAAGGSTQKTQAHVAGSTAQEREEAAGLKEHSSENKEVTAASSSVIESDSAGKKQVSQTGADTGRWVDFADVRRQVSNVRRQVSTEQVLKHLGLFDQLHRSGGSRSQYRGTCPIHVGDGKPRRTFSVNLDKQAFRCFSPECAAHGNVLDLWAAVRQLTLREAALDLMDTFHLTSTVGPEQTEKRNPLESNASQDGKPQD